SGFDPKTGTYDPSSWQYDGMAVASNAGSRERRVAGGEAHGSGGAKLPQGRPPHTDPTLEHPRCVFQLLRRHYARYTPEVVERVCGVPRERFLEVAEALCANSGRERTSAFAYAVGWTHHANGVQFIRTAAIVQLLLGNMGRPGGGIMALRGHASIQGSTDIPTLYNLLPGYLPMPIAGAHGNLEESLDDVRLPAGFWGRSDTYVVSLLKAWFGDRATADNDFCFDHLPKLTGDHSIFPTVRGMLDGTCKGFFVPGENPAVGSPNAGLHRKAMAKLDWLVVRELVETETASFWYNAPEIETGELRTEGIPTEVFLLPAAAHTEKDGTFTNTQRLLQWHRKAVEPVGDQRSELWFYYHLGRRIREKLAASTDPRDRPMLDLAWEYPTEGPHEEPSAAAVLREIGGVGPDGRALPGYLELKADGSTACGCWIYSGVYADEVNQADRRKPGSEQSWVAPEWGWAWPYNRRILYNRASADPEGRPWSERKRYVWWDEAQGRWTGHDNPDFGAATAPGYDPPDDATAERALDGRSPFVMQADGKGWLFVPNGLDDGPLPTHYEPPESPVANPLYGRQTNPLLETYDRPGNRLNPALSPVYPFVFTTYRLTEHHTAGGMSRTLGYLSELQPEMFCEVSPELARLRGLVNGGWATIVTSRAAIEARVLVTERLRPLRVGGQLVHQVGLPYHWGRNGLATGDGANDLLPIVGDPNVHIMESKANTCDVLPGRRPRGPALVELVEGHRARALAEQEREGSR
ncbi:MAG TPA: molybdopterin dinucleotide binding domain-containing protein, partial [Actinomycetota bacterium]|nr:molybdopterin dinucleotide binding domain-containing protein [Actinomycetota bacterium]